MKTNRLLIISFLVLLMSSHGEAQMPGTVSSWLKITAATNGLTANILPTDGFGWSVDGLGDLDGDGVKDLVVGAAWTNEVGLMQCGALYILFLNSSNTVKSYKKIGGTNFSPLTSQSVIGFAVANIGDVNGDGIPDIAASGVTDSNSGSVWIILLNNDGTVKGHSTIKSGVGGINLVGQVYFGSDIAGIGDLDKDGIPDIAISACYDGDGGTNSGAVYIVFLTSTGGVKGFQKISKTTGGFNGTFCAGAWFGSSLEGMGDLDGDSYPDLAVGAVNDCDNNAGAVWILNLNANGTVKSHQKISSLQGGLTAQITSGDWFGADIANAGDFDNDGVTDLIVTSQKDDDGQTDAGAIYLIFRNTNGTVKSHQKISNLFGNFNASLDSEDFFGQSCGYMGFVNSDLHKDIVVGAVWDDDAGTNAGAIYILSLNYIDNSSINELDMKNYISSTINNNQLNIRFDHAPGGIYTVETFNLMGQKIDSRITFVGSNDSHYTVNINLATYSKGAYLLRIVNKNHLPLSKKFIH